MAEALANAIAFVGIDIGKNSFHVVGLDRSGAIVLRQKWSRGQGEARVAHMLPCLVGMEAWAGGHHLSRRRKALGHDARLMPAKYVRPYSKGQKNDFRDAEAIAEAVQRPTMKFVATKTADQLDLQALHRVWCSRRNSFGNVAFRTHWNGAWCITAKLAADVRMGSKARITAVQRQGQVHPNQRTATPLG